MSEDAPPAGRLEAYEISLGAIAWALAGALFIGIRLAGLLSIPIGGVELDSLSGAWQAHAGNGDSRFVPTLFQAITAWSFELTSSGAPARWLALLASASIPFALYRLRPTLGETGALFATVLLALDPISILTGSTAWIGSCDAAVVLWLWFFTQSGRGSLYATGVAAFIAATSGAVVLPFLIAAAVIRLVRQDYPARDTTLAAAAGVVAGIAVTSLGFGFGWQGVTVPPVQALALGFDSTWAGESTVYLAVLYCGPLLALGVAAALYRGYQCWSEQEWPREFVLVATAFALSLAWVVTAGGSKDPVPLVAASLCAAILLGRELAGVAAPLRNVNWTAAALPLAGLVFAAFIAEAYAVDWARVSRVGTGRDQVIVTGLMLAVLACAGLLASNRRTAAALFVPVAIAVALPTLSGTFGVAFGGPNEPLPSPVSSPQGREIRAIALQTRHEHGGVIALHSTLEDAATWPLRDSGEIVVANTVPAEASVLIWPAGATAPDGFSVLAGTWSLQEERHAPDDDFLDYLRWLSNRNSLSNTFEPVAVYLRTAP